MSKAQKILECSPRRWSLVDQWTREADNERNESIKQKINSTGDRDMHVLIKQQAIGMERTTIVDRSQPGKAYL